MTGDLLYEKTIMSANNTVSVGHNLPAGTYIVVIRTDAAVYEKKLVVIR